jgi:hypothetical protein
MIVMIQFVSMIVLICNFLVLTSCLLFFFKDSRFIIECIEGSRHNSIMYRVRFLVYLVYPVSTLGVLVPGMILMYRVTWHCIGYLNYVSGSSSGSGRR